MARAEYGSLPFREQIAFFRSKDVVPTERWTDLWRDAHDHGFMVAGANERAITEDFHAAVLKTLKEGRTLADFRRDFDSIVTQYGWSHTGSRGWRSRLIYETNLRTSYAAGRHEQMLAIAHRRPYWRYRHSDASTVPRPHHLAWDGIVLPHDDPWWEAHYGPNGWGCKCWVETLAERDLAREGIEVSQAPDDGTYEWTDKVTGEVHRIPRGIDPGWDYAPGRRSWMASQTPPPMDSGILVPPPPRLVLAGARDPLPEPRTAPASRVLSVDLSDDAYVDAFLSEFGVRPGGEGVFVDVAGERLVIGDQLFRVRGEESRLKLRKEGRERYVLLLADTIRAPDEIWHTWGDVSGRPRRRRRYVAQWRVEGESVPALTVFETGADGWVGVTAFSPDLSRSPEYLESRVRQGERVYRRGG